ncbi:MAG: hypothetical protein HC868_16640 [Sphingomonadales bacterium]|nr:hypothetical protein [Sphingomonadales bacterium]
MSDTFLTKTIASTATLRIANIHSLDLFYTPLEERFERITRLARRAMQVPVAAISLLNEDKQWFKSAAGWGISELPREHAICKLTVLGEELLTIADTASDPRVQLWDAELGTLERTFESPGGNITRAVLSPSGALVAVASSDGKVRLVGLDSGMVMQEIAVEDDVVWSAVFSPDGRQVVTASSDHSARIWDAATGTCTAIDGTRIAR